MLLCPIPTALVDKNCSGNFWVTWYGDQGLSSIKQFYNVFLVCKSSPWRPHFKHTGQTVSVANVFLPDTTEHLQGSYGAHATTGQSCFGGIRGDK